MFEAAAECRRPLLQFQSKRVRMFRIPVDLALEDFDEDDDDEEDEDDDDDIYIMMQCLFVTKNHHFLLGVSCNHLNHP